MFCAFPSKRALEPFETVPERFLTLKAVFLVIVNLFKEWETSRPCRCPLRGMVKAVLYPRPGLVPKVPTTVLQPAILQAFLPSSFQRSQAGKAGPCVFVESAGCLRPQSCSDLLFVCFGSPEKGLPESKH